MSLVLGLLSGILWGGCAGGFGFTWLWLGGLTSLWVIGLGLWCRGVASYQVVGYGVVGLLCGLSVTGSAIYRTTQAALPTAWVYHPVWVVGRVVDIPSVAQGIVQHRFQLESVNHHTATQVLKVSGRDSALFTLRSGERWAGWMQLRPPTGFHNPGGFDYVKWMWANHLQGSGFWVNQRASPARLQAATGWLDTLRNHAVALLHRAVTDPVTAGILLALGLGSEGGIDQATWQVFQRTGVVHALSISGLHVGVVALMGYGVAWLWVWVWPQIGLWVPLPLLGRMLGAIAAIGYGGLVGFQNPLLRSVMMLLWGMCCFPWRRVTMGTRFLWTLGVLWLWDPLQVFSMGSVLSVVSVAWIIYCIEGRFGHIPRWKRLLWLQGGLFVGLMPWTVGYFHQVSWIAPVTNGVAGPCIEFLLVPLLLCGFLVGSFWVNGGIMILHGAEWILKGIMVVLKMAAAWPGIMGVHVLQGPLMWLVALFLTGMMWFPADVARLPVWIAGILEGAQSVDGGCVDDCLGCGARFVGGRQDGTSYVGI